MNTLLPPYYPKLLLFILLVNCIDCIPGISTEVQAYPSNLSLQTDTLSSPSIEKSRKIIIQVEHESGGMIPNNSDIKALSKNIYYNGQNIKIGWQQTDSSRYSSIYNHPIYGVGLYGSTFGMKEFGNPIALYGFVAIPIKPNFHSRWNFNYRISLGLSSNFRPYSETDNPVNILIGSRQNVYIDLGFQVNYRLSSRFQIGSGFAFHHFSNGATRLPNKGINLIPLTAALTYTPNGHKTDYHRAYIPPHQKDYQIHFNYAWGMKQLNMTDRKLYTKSTLGMYVSQSRGYKWRLGAGFDVFYSESGKYKYIAEEKSGQIGSLFSTAATVHADHVLQERLAIYMSAGWYLKRNEFNGEISPYYLRIGTKYQVWRDIFMGVSIKAHAGKADFVEWTTGYSLKCK
jgi:hypothetical protein